MEKSLAVVGAGLAGLTAALAARRLGLEVSLYEQAPDFRQVGGGIMIHSNGMRVLESLGLLNSFIPRMRLTSRAHVEAAGGGRLSTLHTRRLDVPHNQVAVVLRYELQEHLLAAAEREGVRVRFGLRLAGLD